MKGEVGVADDEALRKRRLDAIVRAAPALEFIA